MVEVLKLLTQVKEGSHTCLPGHLLFPKERLLQTLAHKGTIPGINSSYHVSRKRQ